MLQEMSYPSPIQPDKESADKDYDNALRLSLRGSGHIDRIAIVAGTHNEESCRLLAESIAVIKHIDP